MSDKNHGHWTRADIDSARQEGWLEGKEYCKKEVLKILSKNTTIAYIYYGMIGEYFIKIDAIKEMEKL